MLSPLRMQKMNQMTISSIKSMKFLIHRLIYACLRESRKIVCKDVFELVFYIKHIK